MRSYSVPIRKCTESEVLSDWSEYERTTLLKMGSYSSTMMCQYWDNRLIY